MRLVGEIGVAEVIAFVIGTTAEAIKVAPVIHRLRRRGEPIEIWATYQHTDSLDTTLGTLDLGRPHYVFTRGVNGKTIERPAQMIAWYRNCRRSLKRDRKQLRERLGEHPLLVVHGDTMTTVFGAFAARRLKVPSAHIEAGLRSGNLLRPFPEEIDRRIVGKVAMIHFAPNAEATELLRRKGKDAVDTKNNTAIDGVLDTVDVDAPPAKQYGLVLLHRYELMSKPALIKETLEVLDQTSPVPLTILTDAYSGGPVNEALRALNSSKITASPKLEYPAFVNAMNQAEFVVTDSGGIQQEVGLLGVPTLLHRQLTESPDGIGANVVLSGWEMSAIEKFMTDYPGLRRDFVRPETSPSDIIVSALEARGYLSTASGSAGRD